MDVNLNRDMKFENPNKDEMGEIKFPIRIFVVWKKNDYDIHLFFFFLKYFPPTIYSNAIIQLLSIQLANETTLFWTRTWPKLLKVPITIEMLKSWFYFFNDPNSQLNYNLNTTYWYKECPISTFSCFNQTSQICTIGSQTTFNGNWYRHSENCRYPCFCISYNQYY